MADPGKMEANWEVALRSAELAAIPAVVMLLGSVATILSSSPPPKIVAHALQHLAGGIMLAAISMELVPPLAKAKGVNNIIGIVIGFTLGVVLMLALSVFLDADDGGSQEGEEEGDLEETHAFLRPDTADGDGDWAPERRVGRPREGSGFDGELPSPQRPRSRSSSESRESKLASKMSSKMHKAFHRSDESELQRLAAERVPSGGVVPPFPITFAACVYIDSAMDGLLVGLALVTGKSAGIYMAAAMAVEMGFLGLTFAASCTKQPKAKAMMAVIAGPCFLMLGSAVGGFTAHALMEHEPALVGCTAFGVAALLYMVCEELLVTAHEEGMDHVWWVDMQVFVGFLLALLSSKLLEEDPSACLSFPR